MRLSSGDAELVMAPELGGSVVSWTIGGRPIFRPANPAATDARANACYPLVPFSNRVANRRFLFEGREYVLPALLNGQAIHGAGWQCAWTQSGTRLAMSYPGGELWPFAFDAEQVFDLEPTALTVTMRITNRHESEAPAAIGLHPFFPRGPHTRLQLAAKTVWISGSDKIPVEEVKVPPEWDFSHERELGDADIDHCFAGWNGHYALTWPDRKERVVVRAGAPFGHLVLYIPRGQSFTAIEPVSNMNDGLNHMQTSDDHGMRILEPGETLEGRISMIVEALG